MNKYELLMILSASLDDGAKEALIEKVKGLLEAKGAKIENVDNWGVKKLTYAINYKTEGVYVLINLESEANVPAEVEKQLNITDGVVRAMFVRK